MKRKSRSWVGGDLALVCPGLIDQGSAQGRENGGGTVSLKSGEGKTIMKTDQNIVPNHFKLNSKLIF
jgi:hypothetical protein